MGRRQRQPRIAATEAIARRSLRLPDWRSVTVVAAGLLAVLVYFNSLAGDFVWDDRKLILDDRAVKSWQHLGEIFSQDFFHRNEDDLPYGYYRPLTTVSYLIDHSIWGLRPWG